MTSERANEILVEAQKSCTCGPWVDYLDKIMSKPEIQEVKNHWAKMNGYTTFLDALLDLAKAPNCPKK